MAVSGSIGGSGRLFRGEDKRLDLIIYNEALNAIVDSAGWEVKFVARRRDDTGDPPFFEGDATISGVYNSIPGTNTQKWSVVLTSDDTDLFPIGVFRYAWKRMNSGVETVLAYGSLTIELATTR